MTTLYLTIACALLVVGLIAAVVHLARKMERERIKRWLAEHAVEVTDDVVDIILKPPPSDGELLDAIRPDGVPDDGRT